MKSKGQLTSESEAKEKLIIFVYEYLVHNNCKPAADLFKEGIQYHKEIKLTDSEGPGFLYDWWCVFWDLYCASPERRHTNAEPSLEAKTYHDFTSQMSPQIGHSITSPNPQQFMGGGPRHGPPPHGQPRGPGPRMQVPPPPQGHLGGPHGPGGPPSGFIPSGSPRYAQHPSGPAGPPPQPHMNQPVGPMFGPGPEQMGPSPGLNRMTPGGPPSGPPQQPVVGPPQQPPQMVGMPGQPQMVGPPPGQGPPQMNPMQPTGPPRNGSQPGSSAGGGWQGGNVNYNVNSPANQSCYPGGPGSNQPPNQVGGPMMMNEVGGMMEVKSSPGVNGGEPSTPRSHTDEYVMPVTFGQDTSDQCESAEILKLKQDMQEATSKMYDQKDGEYCLSTDFTDNGREWKPQ